MGQFSLKARTYISLVILSGVIAACVAWQMDNPRWLHEFYALALLLGFVKSPNTDLATGGFWKSLSSVSGLAELTLGCLLAARGARIKVVLYSQQGRQGEKNRMSMSLAFVPTFVMIYTLGPVAGVLAGICTTPFKRKETPFHRIAFNGASGILCALAAALILRIPGFAPLDWNPFGGGGDAAKTLIPLLGILTATATYYLLNTLLVVGAISLTTGQKALTMWKQLLWTGPGYFAGASCAAIILALLPLMKADADEYMSPLWDWALVSFPIPTVIYWLYKYHAQLDQEKLARIEVLNRSKEELQQINVELMDSKEDLQQINVALERSKEDLQQLFTSTVESLALAIDAKDRYTNQHIQRVKWVAVAVAQELGLDGRRSQRRSRRARCCTTSARSRFPSTS